MSDFLGTLTIKLSGRRRRSAGVKGYASSSGTKSPELEREKADPTGADKYATI
jgi:hypothetical protein